MMNDKFSFIFAMLVIAIFAVIPVNAEVTAEITEIKIVPEPPIAEEPVDFMITVKNTGTESGDFRVECACSDFERSVYPASRYSDEFSLDPNCINIASINGTLDNKGNKTIFFYLEKKTWRNRFDRLSGTSKTVRYFNVTEVSDKDNDGLLFWEEVEIYHTDPNNNDTDFDCMHDGIDPDPLIPTGDITIISNPPGADVYLNEVYNGTTNASTGILFLSYRRASVDYTIKLTKQGYHPKTEQIKLHPCENNTLTISLDPIIGSIDVSSDPSDAKIYLDGKYEGKTPRFIPNVPIGPHNIELNREGNKKTTTVLVEDGKTAKVFVFFNTGSVEITSPINANVYLDGAYKGVTPVIISNINPGIHSVTLKKYGVEFKEVVKIERGEMASVAPEMKSLLLNATRKNIPIGVIGAALIILLIFVGFVVHRLIKRRKPDEKPPKEEEKREKEEGGGGVPAFFPTELKSFYTDIKYIGEGGFARVFKARNKKGEIVALKIPKSLDAKSGRLFIDEVSAWKGLKHENIVRLYYYNISPIAYLEMEFVESSLDEVKKPMLPEDAAEMIFTIAEGLSYAHKNKIIHRDLKPGNILLKNSTPKISDWGLSKVMGASESSSGYGYTPLYAAPELIYPDEFGRTNERTDIFQLGTIFYELLTGENPFYAETRAGVEASIHVREPINPSEINHKISGKCDEIVMKCLQKGKEQRYQNVHELRVNLASYLKEEYKKSLKVSTDSGDTKKSALYCANLATINAKVGDFNETIKYADDLKNYVKGERIKLAERMANAFRIILDIRTNWCNKNVRVRDVNRKYRELKEILVEEDYITEMEKDKDLGMVIKEMNAELREDEYLDDKHVENLEYFCVKFVEKWIARFLR